VFNFPPVTVVFKVPPLLEEPLPKVTLLRVLPESAVAVIETDEAKSFLK